MVMLLSETDNPVEYIDNDDWFAELKRDGNRVIVDISVYKNKDTLITFMNRNGEPFTKDVPKVIIDRFVETLKSDDYVKSHLVLDGELTYTDLTGHDHRTQAQDKTAEPTLWLFDILELDNENFKNMEWYKRKVELKTLCDIYQWIFEAEDNSIRYLPHYGTQKNKQILLDRAKENNMEGLVFKYKNGKYENDRSKDCIKYKFTKTDDFIVIGYTEANKTSINSKGKTIENKRYPYFRALILAQYNKEGNLVPKGQVGGGFTDVDLPIVTKKLHKEYIFKSLPKSYKPRGVHSFIDKDFGQPKDKINWLKKEDWFIVETEFAGLTEYGTPFQPRFLKLRTDKKIEECVEK